MLKRRKKCTENHIGNATANGDAMIKTATQTGYRDLFADHIMRDFAVNERRPLFLLKRLHRRGLYKFWTLHDDTSGEMLAYAGFLLAPDTDAMLLDYLAVEPQYRGKGIGSRFLKEISAYCDTGGVLIECEAPESAGSLEEKDIRLRRIAFYLKNGAVETRTRWRFFGVDYDLLWLPVKRAADEVDIGEAIVALYGSGLPRWLAILAVPFLRRNVRNKP